jgi:hypothetical protein
MTATARTWRPPLVLETTDHQVSPRAAQLVIPAVTRCVLHLSREEMGVIDLGEQQTQPGGGGVKMRVAGCCRTALRLPYRML